MKKTAATVLAGLSLAAVISLSACSSSSTAGAPASDAAKTSAPMSDKASAPMSDKPSAPMSDKPSSSASPSMDHSTEAMTKGAYITFDQYQSSMAMYANSKVVLFFDASWCPTCQATNKNLSAGPIPDGLVIVSVDYDSSTELKQKYGVTQQHTFVLIDHDGNKVKSWSGSATAAEIEAQVK